MGKEQAMATETDTWQAAWIIAEQYGQEGVAFAAQMAHSFQIGGKMDSYKVWVSIMEKVETLTSPQLHDDAAAQ
jgi:hypothetical protein